MKRTRHGRPSGSVRERCSALALGALTMLLAVAGCGGNGGDGGGGVGAPAPGPEGAGSSVSITVANQTSSQATVYLGFNGNTLACYAASDFPFCSFDTGNPVVCSFPLAAGASQVIPFGQGCKVSPVISANMIPWGDCPVTMAEFTLADGGNDTYDLSLVNNLNVGMSIVPTSGATIGPITSPTGNQQAIGVYPQLCTVCNAQDSPPQWPGCPAPDPSQCKSDVAAYPCQLTQPSGASYTVNLLP
ncbi:MAG: thaumatin family protein [Thermodesulfobacteriota bacterium]